MRVPLRLRRFADLFARAPADVADADADGPRRVLLRIVLVAAQAATVLLTWRVWEHRTYPPMLPLLPGPPVDMGWPLLASLAVVLAAPRVGVPLHAATLAGAIVLDQSRLQPHVISLAWLLAATTGRPGGLVVARASLVALWLFAGIHKLTSPAYYTIGGPFMLRGTWPDGPAALAPVIAGGVALEEIALGVGALVPACRRIVAGAAAAFHLGTFLVLSRGLSWDAPVWPWNLALACMGPLLVAPWRGPGLGAAWWAAPRSARAAAAALLVMPAGYWLGVVDAFLAHCVYAHNRPKAYLCTVFSRTDVEQVCLELGVVLPPAHRLYAPFFRGVGRPGEWLEIEDPRWIARARGFAFRKIRWEDVAGPPPPDLQSKP